MRKDSIFLIIGLGLLGGSYAQGLKKAGFTVTALDLDPEAIGYALSHGLIDRGSSDFDSDLVFQADYIIFGLYPHAFIHWIEDHPHCFKPGALISDVTGVKGKVVETIQSLLDPDVEFIACHPMAGREVSGVRYADCSLFEPANFIITPTEKNTEQAVAWAKELGEILHFHHIAVLSIPEHDEMIGFLSQLTHVIAVTLMNTSDKAHLVDYTGDSFRDLTRIAKINENLWTELFLMNKENLVREIDDFTRELTHFRNVLQDENQEEMKRLFRQSTQRRKRFDK